MSSKKKKFINVYNRINGNTKKIVDENQNNANINNQNSLERLDSYGNKIIREARDIQLLSKLMKKFEKKKKFLELIYFIYLNYHFEIFI